MKPSDIDSILSNPQLPIFIAFFILIFSICYMSIIRPYIKNQYTFGHNNGIKTLQLNNIKSYQTKQNKDSINYEKDKQKAPSITIGSIAVKEQSIDVRESKPFQWFPIKNNQDKIRSKQSKSDKDIQRLDGKSIDDIHEKIDRILIEKEKKKTMN